MTEDVPGWNGAAEIMADIEQRWPLWVEMAKRNPGKFETENVQIAVALLAYGMTSLLHSQVRSADISVALAGMFDLSVNRNVLEEIWALQRQRQPIMGYLAALLMSQGDWLRHNPYPRRRDGGSGENQGPDQKTD